MTAGPSRRRRWFQFRLRALLIAILVLSLPLSWFAVRMERARRQREVVEEIEGLGGYPGYAWEFELDPLAPNPSWLRTLLGNDFFDPITYVNLGGTEITNAGLEHLYGLPGLDFLDLRDTEVDDAGLEHLGGMSNLEYLLLNESHVTPEGVKNLQAALPNCKIEY